ncbi:MAG: indole-3-glycerol phosphate synthase TrpC [Endomicrobiales bacterium]
MNNILNDIISRTKETLVVKQKDVPITQVRENLEKRTGYRNFRHAVARHTTVNIIAELKKSSPSAGTLRADFDPASLARTYAANGASAISVLTEEHYFNGSLEHLGIVRQNVPLPLLRKDFIIDPYQIYESAAAGADAILLIAALLSADELRMFIKTAANVRLDCLVEVHDEADLSRAIAAGAVIIGINNRDLNTFLVDLETTARLLPLMPREAIVVMESGITTKTDIDRFKTKGVSAFLVGGTLMRSEDPGKTLRELKGVE